MADKAEKKLEKKAKKNADKKPKNSKSIGQFFREFKVEWKKIVWPTIGTTFKNFWVVLSSIITISAFVGGLDYGLTTLLKMVMEIT